MNIKRMAFCPQCASPLTSKEEDGFARRVCVTDECGFIFYNNPTPVVAALIEHDGDVILARNVGWPETWFGLITGFLERGESPEEGVLREAREELGLVGEVVSMIGVYPFEKMNQIIIAYHVEATGEITLNEELAAIKRVPPEKLRPWPFATGDAVRDWLASRKKQA